MLPTHSILDLHRTITAIRSVSGGEGPLADHMENLLMRHEVCVARQGNSVLATLGEGPMLLFGTHLDTAPPVPGWSRDPWRVEVVDGRVYGLGSTDAKAAVAAMTVAFLAFAEAELPVMLGLALVECEETTGMGRATILADLEQNGVQPVAAVVGEPTGLDLVVATSVLSMEQGGALAVLGMRSTPALTIEVSGSSTGAVFSAELEVVLDPLLAAESGGASPITAAVLAARPEARLFASATLDGQGFMNGIPAVKCGPGSRERSHAPDEYVEEAEVLDGARFYARLVRTWAERILGRTV